MLNASGAESKTAKYGGAWMSRFVALCRLLGMRPRKPRLAPEEAAQGSSDWMNSSARREARSAAAAMAVMTLGEGAFDETGAFAAAAACQRLGGAACAIETRQLGVKVAQQFAHIRGQIRQR